MTSSVVVYIKCVFKKREIETMETEKYLTLISDTHNVNNFTVNFWPYLTFGEDWEVALVQAYLPHRDSHFADAFKAHFPNNKFVGGLSVFYNMNPTAALTVTKTTSVRIDDIIYAIGRGTTKLDVLKMIYTVAWNKIMYDIKTDSSVAAAYPKNDGRKLLHQTLEETKYGVTLKGYTDNGGRFTLDKTLAQMMDIMNVGGTGVGNDVRYVFRGNDNMKRMNTMTWSSTQVNLYSDVDWVFTTLHTPWSPRYIPNKVYKHVNINCDMIVSQQVNNNFKYILHHAEGPDDDSLMVPHRRMYMKLHSVSYSSAQIWITHGKTGIMPTIPFEKTRVTLHFRKKKPLQTM